MFSSWIWGPPQTHPALTSAEVHVWKAMLTQPATRIHDLEHTLAAEERDRANRFVFAEDRNRFIVGRGVLRTVLGCYLGIEPGRLRFRSSPYGKPELSGGAGSASLRFNVSHSGGMALYAVTQGREIGVDLERIRPEFATTAIAERFFAPGEIAALRALPPHSRCEDFFACWTRKKAYIKARGEGLSLPLDRFEVSFALGEPPALLSVHDDPREAARWSIRALFPGPDYAAALAVEGHDWRLECWQCPEP